MKKVVVLLSVVFLSLLVWKGSWITDELAVRWVYRNVPEERLEKVVEANRAGFTPRIADKLSKFVIVEMDTKEGTATLHLQRVWPENEAGKD